MSSWWLIWEIENELAGWREVEMNEWWGVLKKHAYLYTRQSYGDEEFRFCSFHQRNTIAGTWSMSSLIVTGKYIYMLSHPSLHLVLLSSWCILFHIVSNKQIQSRLTTEDNTNIGSVTCLFYHTIIYRWSLFFSPCSDYPGPLVLWKSTWLPRLLLIRFIDPPKAGLGTAQYRTCSNLNSILRVAQNKWPSQYFAWNFFFPMFRAACFTKRCAWRFSTTT